MPCPPSGSLWRPGPCDIRTSDMANNVAVLIEVESRGWIRLLGGSEGGSLLPQGDGYTHTWYELNPKRMA